LKAAASSPIYATASEPVANQAPPSEAAAAKEAKATAEPVNATPAALAPTAREPAAPAMLSMQYAITKLQVQQAHRVGRGERVLVAVIDSRIDAAHPELDGTIVKQIDVLDDKDAKPHAHGTAMAGAIVAKSQLTGVAPGARVVAVRAFSNTSAGGASSTSFDLARAVDRAVAEGARVINLSFAGPQDPILQQSLKMARDKGIVLIAAAGNAGPKSAPLYPAADPNVIAVTATDSDDQVYKGANRGKHIAVAAPGVDILVPAPEQNYELSTGTSVAAAHVSGVAALLLARNPALSPDNVRQILTDSARSMGPKGQGEYGAGLTDAYKALTLDPSAAARGPAASAAPPR
jgi:subtilisin family serine protease